eukprot:6405467-Alexandrium_andersonii.AAC.1
MVIGCSKLRCHLIAQSWDTPCLPLPHLPHCTWRQAEVAPVELTVHTRVRTLQEADPAWAV